MLKTTYIGHACLLIQSKDSVLLSDPVWFDPHWQDINVLSPGIELDFDKIPQVDILNLSHQHQDHFDVRTLAFLRNSKILSPEVKILVPNDPLMHEVLRALDYNEFTVVENFEPIKVRDLTLTYTPSLIPETEPTEHGMMIHDGEVTVWNQVDTVVSPEVIEYMFRLHGQIDFAHVRFEPLIEGNLSFHKQTQLPFEEYGSFLKVAKKLAPKFAVPGSAAFRYCDRFAFLNAHSFPASPDQFLMDLGEFCPEVKTSPFSHGDVAEISKGGTKILPRHSEFVSIRKDDDYIVEFKPVMEVLPIESLTEDEGERQKEMQAAAKFIEEEFLDRLMGNELMEVWRHWNVCYQLEVFGGAGDSQIWSVDFGGESKLVKGRIGKINLYEGIACSELCQLIKKEANWDFVGASAQFRTFHNIYRVGEGQYEYYPQEKKFPQPLMEAFPQNREMDLEKFMKYVRQWKDKA